MRTTLLLNQHKKCSCLLEMIVRCDQRIQSYKESIQYYNRFEMLGTDVKGFYYKRWEITLAIKERLIASYSRVLTSIVKPTVDRILQTT